MSVFSERLKQSLSMRGIKQIELANEIGTCKSLITSYVKGICEPSRDNLILISKVLNVSPAWLMGLDDESMDSTVKEQTAVDRKAVIDFLKNEDNIEYLKCLVRLVSYQIEYLEAIDELERSMNDDQITDC